jgi:hypothetical protein
MDGPVTEVDAWTLNVSPATQDTISETVPFKSVIMPPAYNVFRDTTDVFFWISTIIVLFKEIVPVTNNPLFTWYLPATGTVYVPADIAFAVS